MSFYYKYTTHKIILLYVKRIFTLNFRKYRVTETVDILINKLRSCDRTRVKCDSDIDRGRRAFTTRYLLYYEKKEKINTHIPGDLRVWVGTEIPLVFSWFYGRFFFFFIFLAFLFLFRVSRIRSKKMISVQRLIRFRTTLHGHKKKGTCFFFFSIFNNIMEYRCTLLLILSFARSSYEYYVKHSCDRFSRSFMEVFSAHQHTRFRTENNVAVVLLLCY